MKTRIHYNTFLSTRTPVLRGKLIVSHKCNFYGDLFLFALMCVCLSSVSICHIPLDTQSTKEYVGLLLVIERHQTRVLCNELWLSGRTATSLNDPAISPLCNYTLLKRCLSNHIHKDWEEKIKL